MATKEEILAKLRTKNANEMTGHDLVEHLYDVVSELLAEPPCVYEVRDRRDPFFYDSHYPNAGRYVSSSWCQTHGWDCPNEVKE